jgi:Ni/Fe-hydrogenase 1 B-type cytochrome subunit
MRLRLIQPREIRIIHWLLFVVTVLKLWSGFYISSPSHLWGFSGMHGARMLHANLTSVLAALLAFRLYFAVVSGDWRHLLFWRRSHGKELVLWLRYVFYRRGRPPLAGKYHAGPRLLFTAIFLTMPVFYFTGVIMLELPFLRWLTVLSGSPGLARLFHFLAAVALTVLAVLHIYLTLWSRSGRLLAMIRGQSVITENVPGEEVCDGDSCGGPG